MSNHLRTDEEILADSIKSPSSFGLLVDRYQEPFLRKAQYILHSPDFSEDAVQDTFLKIYKNADKFSKVEGASFSSWAYKILTNTCYDYSVKKTRDARARGTEFSDLDALGARDTSGEVENTSFVSSVLTRLPAKVSRLLTLYFFEDKSYQEIADLEQVSLSAVKSGLHRAKKEFKSIALNLR